MIAADQTIQTLVVEDDSDFRRSLVQRLEQRGFSCTEAGTLDEAHRAVESRPPQVIVLDLELPDGRGLDLRLNRALPPDTPFLVVSGDGSARAARAALRQGATDYLTKPLEAAPLNAALHAVRTNLALRREVGALRAELRDAGCFGRLVGRSAVMQQVYDLIDRVAPTSVPVLITGESGTGKELVAQTLHEMSPRAEAPFVAINCGAIPETLIESKLFGHEKGSFTGAQRRHVGVFERADGGTLFLDEIGEMPPELQVRLLRVLETSAFTRIGGDRTIDVDVRILAATNRDPLVSVSQGKLREDLFHRLNVFPIHLPPLRERAEDVTLLAEHILGQLNRKEQATKRWTRAALARLAEGSWSGNVRELKNVVQRAWILAGEEIDAAALTNLTPAGAVPPATPTATPPETAGDPQPDAEPEDDPAWVRVPVGSSLAETERQLILKTLAFCDGNKRKTARVLGVSVKTIYNRLSEYGMSTGESSA
ncbi:MAG: sigma-54 dependent transcriptional regulator [Planctomycetota bacterium]|nr:sigma-54 dependent transcriptional regulator [Planctomycetota bacterium]